MKRTLGMLGFAICLNVAANPITTLAADAGEQNFAKGESLLKHKQYAEARATLEAGLIKNSSHVQAHFNLAEACRGLGAWDCAEEHYETALHLDAKSRITGTREPRLSKMKVWQSLEEVTAWRLLEEAKGLLAGGQTPSDKMKQAGRLIARDTIGKRPTPSRIRSGKATPGIEPGIMPGPSPPMAGQSAPPPTTTGAMPWSGSGILPARSRPI